MLFKSIELEVLKDAAEFFSAREKFSEVEINKVVLYDGNPDAEIMVIARDLGQKEVELGVPLIGPAGSLFRNVSKEEGFDPTKDFFLCNTVPLKPKGNKAFSQEVRSKMSWVLKELVNIVSPNYYLLLGKEATECMGLPVGRMGDVVGREFDVGGNILFPSYHPSYIKRLLNKGVDGKNELRKPLRLLRKHHE